MEDDIFLQLSNLVNNDSSDNKRNFGGYTAEYGGAPDSTMFTTDHMVVPDVKPKKAENGRRSGNSVAWLTVFAVGLTL